MKHKRYKIFLAICIGAVMGIMTLLTHLVPHFIYVWIGYIITSVIELLANEITEVDKRTESK